MAKTKKAAVAAITITEDCERDSEGFGALQFVKCDRKHMGIDRPGISALKAELFTAGFETNEISLAEWLNDPSGGQAADEVAKRWLESADVLGWDPREPVPDNDWALVAVLFVGDPAGENNDDAVAILARPANASAPWPFPKTEGGGPEVQSEPAPAFDMQSGEANGPQCCGGETGCDVLEYCAERAPAMTKTEAHLTRKPAPFELLEPTDALLKTFTPRVEKHGEDDVSAASLGLQIEAPNTILDLLSPSLRATLYAAPEGQVTLPGIVETMPLLRTKVIENLKLTNCYEGWTLRVSWGLDEAMTITKCKVDKFVVTPSDGGSVTLDLRVGSSDISEEEAGWLYGHLRHEIEITLHAPEQKPDAIDGTQATFDADHPTGPTAEDLFAEQHGSGTYDEGDAGPSTEGDGETETEGAAT